MLYYNHVYANVQLIPCAKGYVVNDLVDICY